MSTDVSIEVTAGVAVERFSHSLHGEVGCTVVRGFIGVTQTRCDLQQSKRRQKRRREVKSSAGVPAAAFLRPGDGDKGSAVGRYCIEQAAYVYVEDLWTVNGQRGGLTTTEMDRSKPTVWKSLG